MTVQARITLRKVYSIWMTNPFPTPIQNLGFMLNDESICPFMINKIGMRDVGFSYYK